MEKVKKDIDMLKILFCVYQRIMIDLKQRLEKIEEKLGIELFDEE